MAHARAKLTVLGRQLLVERVLVDGWKPADAAKAMGVSRQTAYKWLRRFGDEGAAGLEDRSSTPRRCPHRLGSEAVASIVAARLDTLHGPHRLAYALGRPRSTIYGVLRRAGVSRLSFIDRPTRTVVRYERERPRRAPPRRREEAGSDPRRWRLEDAWPRDGQGRLRP